MNRIRLFILGGGAIVIGAATVRVAETRPLGHEAQIVIDTILAVPAIKAEPGFTAKMLVAPGELYDPLFMVPRGNSI